MRFRTSYWILSISLVFSVGFHFFFASFQFRWMHVGSKLVYESGYKRSIEERCQISDNVVAVLCSFGTIIKDANAEVFHHSFPLFYIATLCFPEDAREQPIRIRDIVAIWKKNSKYIVAMCIVCTLHCEYNIHFYIILPQHSRKKVYIGETIYRSLAGKC